MKNITRTIFTIFCASIIACSFIGCGNNKKDTTATGDEAVINNYESDEYTNNLNFNDIDDKQFDNFYDFYKTDKFQEEIRDSVKSHTDIDTFYTNILCEGDSLIYQYTLRNKLEKSNIDKFNSTVKESIDNYSEVFESEVDTINTKLKNPCTIIVRYRNNDYSVLYEREFK